MLTGRRYRALTPETKGLELEDVDRLFVGKGFMIFWTIGRALSQWLTIATLSKILEVVEASRLAEISPTHRGNSFIVQQPGSCANRVSYSL